MIPPNLSRYPRKAVKPPPPPPAPPKVTVKYEDEWFPIYDLMIGLIAFGVIFGMGFLVGWVTR